MFAFFGEVAGFLFTWPALMVLMMVIGVGFEHAEMGGFSVASAIVAAAIAFFVYKVPMLVIIWYVIAYLALGFVWSFVRYRLFVKKSVDDLKGRSDSTKRDMLKLLHPRNNIGRIVRWILSWPFSFVDNAIGGFIDSLSMIVGGALKNVYGAIYRATIKEFTHLLED